QARVRHQSWFFPGKRGHNRVEHVKKWPIIELRKQLAQRSKVRWSDSIVGVQPENPITRGMPQTFVAGCGKIVAPGKMMHLRRKSPRYLDRAVFGTGVD